MSARSACEVMRIHGRGYRRGQPLSAREHELLGLLAEGLTNVEAGRRMFLSDETIKSHVRVILWKLDARTRAHAVALGFRGGLLER